MAEDITPMVKSGTHIHWRLMWWSSTARIISGC